MDDRELIIKDILARYKFKYLKYVDAINSYKNDEFFSYGIDNIELTLEYISLYLANKGFKPNFILTLIEDFFNSLSEKHKKLLEYEKLMDLNNNNIHSDAKKMRDEIWNG